MAVTKKKGLKNAIYLDKNRDIEERIEDLLKRMTGEEKVYQTGAVFEEGNGVILKKGKFSVEKAKRNIGKGIGEISSILRHLSPKEGAKLANKIQKFALEHTRLGIPIIIHDECLHGCMAKNSTSFPQAIGLASTWDDELMERIAVAIGRETRSRGIHQALSPTVNITRDPRCGRTEETYGEDPYLASRMAVAFVKGLQSEKIVATPKHFVANFVGDGGRDSYAIHFSERILREIYFPAFEACVKEAGALSFMVAYNALDGLPCSCNKWLLTDILRKEWGFKGFVVSDYRSVIGIQDKHSVAQTKAEAAQKAIEAGMDVELPHIDCYVELINLVKEGKISMEVIDEAVRRILRVKFWLGLFDDPYVNPEYAEKICDCKEHRKLAYEAACKSIVLLKNEGDILPLEKTIKSIAVIGPNANEIRLGGYSGYGMKVITPLAGIKNRVSKNTKVYFVEGCKITGDSKEGFEKAIRIAQKSEVAILVMGNFAGYGDGYTEGESADRSNLDLPGVQEDLILEICKAGKPVIVVLINGSAITITKWLNNVSAVVEAWYPGEEGGNAIADVLFGNYNPGGRLPITFPKTTGQLPLYYNHKPTGRRDDYVDLRGDQALFPFGYGLSYTKFQYSNLKVTPKEIPPYGKIKVSVEVKNIGKYEGDEVVQLYLRDVYSSLSRPVKELKGYKRITLKPGERKRVEFILAERELSFLNRHMEYAVERGTFEVMVGGNSVNVIREKFEVV